MKYKRIGDCLLICMDSLEWMAGGNKCRLPVDLVVTDAPYKLTSGGCTKGGLHERFGTGNGDSYKNDGNLFGDAGPIPHWDEFVPLIFDILRENAHCYLMADGRNQFDMQVAARAAGFHHHGLLRWDKVTATPNRWYMKNDEFTGFFKKGKAFNINDCSSKSGIKLSHEDCTDHPTEKPVALMQMYIENSSKRGETVLDPFMGSGSTGVAAMASGRKFIGIEKSEQWYEVACQRLEDAHNNFQNNLFSL